MSSSIYVAHCEKCKTDFTYDYADVDVIYVTCPCCGAEVRV